MDQKTKDRIKELAIKHLKHIPQPVPDIDGLAFRASVVDMLKAYNLPYRVVHKKK